MVTTDFFSHSYHLEQLYKRYWQVYVRSHIRMTQWKVSHFISITAHEPNVPSILHAYHCFLEGVCTCSWSWEILRAQYGMCKVLVPTLYYHFEHPLKYLDEMTNALQLQISGSWNKYIRCEEIVVLIMRPGVGHKTAFPLYTPKYLVTTKILAPT